MVRIFGWLFWFAYVVSFFGWLAYVVRRVFCVFVGSHKGPLIRFGRFLMVRNVGVVILVRTIYI